MGFSLLLPFIFPLINSYSYPPSNVTLFCNRLVGNFNGETLMFGRPMENGDKITWNGTVSLWANTPARATDSLKWSIWGGPNLDVVPFHMRQDVPSSFTIWSYLVNGKWQGELRGPSMYSLGQDFQVTMQMMGNQYQIFSKGVWVYNYPMKSSTANMMAAEFIGPMKSNWIEMECANPPATTRRPGGGNGGGNGGGHGHGGGHHGGGYSGGKGGRRNRYNSGSSDESR